MRICEEGLDCVGLRLSLCEEMGRRALLLYTIYIYLLFRRKERDVHHYSSVDRGACLCGPDTMWASRFAGALHIPSMEASITCGRTRQHCRTIISYGIHCSIISYHTLSLSHPSTDLPHACCQHTLQTSSRNCCLAAASGSTTAKQSESWNNLAWFPSSSESVLLDIVKRDCTNPDEEPESARYVTRRLHIRELDGVSLV